MSEATPKKSYAMQIVDELGADAAMPHNILLIYQKLGSAFYELRSQLDDLKALYIFFQPDMRAYETWHDKVIPASQREIERLHQENADLRALLAEKNRTRSKQVKDAKK
jgi:hypothetical protein